MIKDIFMGIHSDEYAEKVFEQVEWDSGIDGFEGGSSVAIFGTPGSGRFEFVLTGRHCTRRCDGDSMKGAAFGGPIFYGHAARGFNESPKHEDNAYWYQAVRANEVYQMLDGKQRKAALLGKSRGERGKKTVELSGKKTGLDGIRVGDLAADQRGHVMKVVGDLLAPFREEDAQEAMKHIKAGGIETFTFLSIEMKTSAMTKSGTSGNWRDPVWSRISGAYLTSMRGFISANHPEERKASQIA